jgi:hypothetical protein
MHFVGKSLLPRYIPGEHAEQTESLLPHFPAGHIEQDVLEFAPMVVHPEGHDMHRSAVFLLE